MIKIVVNGALGRMGQRVLACAADDAGVSVVGAVDVHEERVEPHVTTDLAAAVKAADVVIDFTSHVGIPATIEVVAKAGKALVIGTTGLTRDEQASLERAAKQIPIVYAPNMSVGVNLLFQLVGQVAKALGTDYDVEIVETHHNQKKDAPSGTARKLAENIAAALGRDLEQDGVYGREGITGARGANEIGIHAVRAGDIVGEHTVLFAGPGERIELTHRAHSRDTFARGAVRAARWVAGKAPGLYSMLDVLGLA
ncbi:MAG: 4-hydroxy-tetrahydrodipicolinate reductase [Verrucomicrobia bacterium]|nr:4-hydroxy-tetrahydrodipicolinate reductase [Verrucomicrobiota bacterium]